MAKKTPEGKVKSAIKELLAEYDIRPAKDAGTFDQANGWYYMASSGEFGVKGIPDFVGHVRNNFFSIEAKKPGAEPKGFQALQVEAIINSGGYNKVIDGPERLAEFEEWVKEKLRCQSTKPSQASGKSRT